MKKTLLLLTLLIFNIIANAQDAINKNTSKSGYELYIGYGLSNFNASSSEFSKSIFSNIQNEMEIGDTINRYTENYHVDQNFKNKHTIAAGIKKYEPLVEHLNLFYGIGLQFMQFTYDPIIDTTTEISQKLVLVEKANGNNKYEVIFSDLSSQFSNSSTISVAEKTSLLRLQLDLGMEYELTNALSMSLGGSLYSPLAANLNGKTNSPIFLIDENGNLIEQSRPNSSKSTTAFTAYQINAHIGLQYQIHPKLRLYGQFSLPSYKSLIDVSEKDGGDSVYYLANDVRATHFLFGLQMHL